MAACPVLKLRRKNPSTGSIEEVITNYPQEPERDFDGRVDRSAKIKFEEDYRNLKYFLDRGYAVVSSEEMAREDAMRLEREAALKQALGGPEGTERLVDRSKVQKESVHMDRSKGEVDPIETA